MLALMLKKLPNLFRLPALAALFALLLPGRIHAQGVDSYTFTGMQSTYFPNAFDSIMTAGAGGQIDDGVFRNVRLGFSMDYAGSTFNTIQISCNGFIKFGTDQVRDNGYMQGNNYQGDILASTNDNYLVAALDMDLVGYQGRGKVSIQRDGAAPNRFLTVEWKNLRRFGNNGFNGGDSLDFQLSLYENGVIEMHYGRMLAASQDPRGAQVGLKGSGVADIAALTGSSFTSAVTSTVSTNTLLFSNLTIPPYGYMFRFAPAAPSSIDASVRSVILPSDTRSGCPLSTAEPLLVTVRNSGLQEVSDVTISAYVNRLPANQLPFHFDPALTSGQEAVVSVPVDLSNYGGYFVEAVVTLSGDSVIRNDTASNVIFLNPPTLVPGPTTVVDIDDAAAKGWLESAAGATSPGAGTPVGQLGPGPGNPQIWQEGINSLPGTIYTRISNQNVGRTPWLFHMALRATTETGISFKLAVATDQGQPITTVYDDSLKVMYTADCGLTWRALAGFSQADLTAGTIGNTLKTFTYRFATQPGVFSVGFMVKDNNTGTPQNAAYRWFLDDISFATGTNISVDTALVPTSGGIVAGFCPRNDLPISVRVSNRGVTTQDSIVLGYRYDEGPVMTTVFRTPLVGGTSSTIALNPVGPGHTGTFRVRIFSINPQDQIHTDDTLYLFLLIPPAQGMTGATLYGFQNILSGGYYQAAGRTEVPVANGQFHAGTAFGAGEPTAALEFGLNTPAGEVAWLISPMYYYNVGAMFNFSAAVTRGSTSNQPASTLGQDTLHVLYRLRCGPWQTLAYFSQQDVDTGSINNVLKAFSFGLQNAAPDSVQFAFRVSRAAPVTFGTAAWHITRVRTADVPTAVKGKLSLPDLAVYPNPAHDRVRVLFGKAMNATLTVKDLSGRTLIRTQANGTQTAISVSALAPGLYSLHAETQEGTASRQFSVE